MQTKLIVYILFLWFASSGCKVEDLDRIIPQIDTGVFERGANATQGKVTGNISELSSNVQVDRHGHIWSKQANVDIETFEGNTEFLEIGNETFESGLDDLIPGERYYCKAYAIAGEQIYYGEEISFTTNDFLGQFIVSPTEIDRVNLFVKVEIKVFGLEKGLPLDGYGITWSQSTNPDILTNNFVTGPGSTVLEDTFKFESIINPEGGNNFIRPFVQVKGKSFYGASKELFIGDFWTNKDSFTFGAAPKSSFVHNNKAYLLSTGLFEFDPKATIGTQWRSIETDFGDLREMTAFSINGRSYIGGGPSEVFWEFDPQSGKKIQQIAPYQGPASRNIKSFVIKGKAYVGGGNVGNTRHKSFYEFSPPSTSNPQGVWREVSPLPTGRTQISFFATEEKGYFSNRGALYKFTPPSSETGIGEWKTKGLPLYVRDRNTSFGIAGNVYLGLGWEFSYFKDFFKLEEGNEGAEWEPIADFPGNPRRAALSFVIDGRAYIGFGFGDFGNYYDFWEYIPEEDQ